MSDYDLPDLPSDEDLGITDEDRELLDELGDDGPEMTDAELQALLGDTPSKPAAPVEPVPRGREAARAAKKAAKEARREERRRAKEERRRAKEAKRAEAERKAPAAEREETDAERAERVARSLAAAATGQAEAAPPVPPPAEKPGPAVAEGPRSRWRGPATLAALFVISLVASSRTGIPRPVTDPLHPDTAFSSLRAMSSLIEIARDAHPPGSPEHARVREYLLGRLDALEIDSLEVQTTTSMLQRGGLTRAATVRNVVARIDGTDPTGTVLLTAHYDGRELSVAASDDGVGVVTILESLRALLAGEPLRNDLVVLITDAEELGLLGARAFVDEHRWLEDVRIVLSVEMRGAGGPSIMFETNDENGWVVRALRDFDPRPFANSMADEVYRRMPNDTDFTPFKEAGKQGLNFAAIDNAHVYHQVYDTPEALDQATLQHHGIHTLAAARHFGDADLATVDAPNVVYFSVPLLGLVVYDQTWVLAISAALLLLFAGTLVLARRAGARPSRTAIGLAVSVAAAALAFGAAYLLLGWLPRFHPEAGSLPGSTYHREGWYVIALVGIVLTAVSGLYGVARRWLSPLELGAGAVVLPVACATVLGFAAPLAAMNLQWPVIAGLMALGMIALLGARAGGIVGSAAGLLLAVPVLFLLVPMTELVWLALTFDVAAPVTVLIAVTLMLCTPALEALRHPNVWWAPLTGLVVAAGGVGMGLLGSRPDAERPSPSTLAYAYEHGSGMAVWTTDPEADSLDREATAWAVERAGGSFDGQRDLTTFAYPVERAPVAAAPVVSAYPPEVVVARDSIDGQTRRVTLHVRSRIGAEYMAFMYDGRGGTRLLTLNGREIAAPDSLRRAEHWGEPDPAVVLELEMPATEAIGLHVIEHLLRPREVLGDGAFERPAHLAPDVTRLSDRAMFRYSVGAFADPRFRIALPRGEIDAAPGQLLPADVATDTTAGAAARQPPDTLAAEPDTSGAPGAPPPPAVDSASPGPGTDRPRPGTGSPTPPPPAPGAASPSGGALTDTPARPGGADAG